MGFLDLLSKLLPNKKDEPGIIAAAGGGGGGGGGQGGGSGGAGGSVNLPHRRSKVGKFSALAITIVVLGGAFFYWNEWRPTQAKRECNKSAAESAKAATDNKIEIYDFAYKLCMRKRGL